MAFLESIIVGVTIALVAAALLGGYRFLVGWLSKRNQVQYIRDIIGDGYNTIKNTTSSGEIPLGVDNLRMMIFESVLRDVKMALDHRTNNVGYKQKYELQRIVLLVSAVMKEGAIGKLKQVPKGMKFYDQHFFDGARESNWLLDS